MALPLAATALCLALATAQFVAPPTDLKTAKGYLDLPVRWKEVPSGICELTPGVKSYSGFVDIAEDKHIFFWFFEARKRHSEDADLTVWINGGPGASSMIGLFQELGPCSIDQNGTIMHNPYAWNNATNLLFIDQPSQVGFSYSHPIPAWQNSSSGDIIQLPSNECPGYVELASPGTCGTYPAPKPMATATSTENAKEDFWKTLQGFMGAFPEYARNGFHFGTESYGGHYGPVFSAYIQEQNALIRDEKIEKARHIDLRTVLIGNGWYDARMQYPMYYNFSLHNTYDIPIGNASVFNTWYNAAYGSGNCLDRLIACNDPNSTSNVVCSQAANLCIDQVGLVFDTITGRDEYDIRELQPSPFPPDFYVDYLNRAEVQKAIGAYTNFSMSSSTVAQGFGVTGDEARGFNIIEKLGRLVDEGVYVIMYHGDADYNCNWMGGEVISQHINPAGFEKAGYQNLTTSDAPRIHGQVKQAGNFAFVRVYESGHEVPFYQPLVALEMFERAVKGVDLAEGKVGVKKGGGYLSMGTERSEFHNGNGTVQWEVLPKEARYNTTVDGPDEVKNEDKE